MLSFPAFSSSFQQLLAPPAQRRGRRPADNMQTRQKLEAVQGRSMRRGHAALRRLQVGLTRSDSSLQSFDSYSPDFLFVAWVNLSDCLLFLMADQAPRLGRAPRLHAHLACDESSHDSRGGVGVTQFLTRFFRFSQAMLQS